MEITSFVPNWEPLKICFDGDMEKVKRYMFMGTTEKGINLYKNIRTRKYINISNDNKYYKYDCDRGYIEISFSDAIRNAEG